MPSDDRSRNVAIMAIPAEFDPVHKVGDEEKHCTILYFGNIDEHSEPERMAGAKEWMSIILECLAEKIPPFTADRTTIEQLGDDDPPAQVAMLDSPNLQDLYAGIRAADDEIADLYDGAEATRYPEYKPHVTLAYGDVPDNVVEMDRDIAFDRLALWWGDERIEFPLTGEEGTEEWEALFSLIASAYPDEFPELKGLF